MDCLREDSANDRVTREVQTIEYGLWEPVNVHPTRVIGMIDFGSQAVDHEINREVIMAGDSSTVEQYTKLVSAHQARHPGGTLPSELQSFECFRNFRLKILGGEERNRLRCLMCGSIPHH